MNIYFHQHCIVIVEKEACLDELPDDYVCADSCRDLALNGFCASDWAFFSNCFPNTPSGKIKDDCRLSCNNCGKYLRR